MMDNYVNSLYSKTENLYSFYDVWQCVSANVGCCTKGWTDNADKMKQI